MKKHKMATWEKASIITVLAIGLVITLLFLTPLKSFTHGFIIERLATETADETADRFESLSKQMTELCKELQTDITETDSSNLPSLDFRLDIVGCETAVTFSNTDDRCTLIMICRDYVKVDKEKITALYNEFAYYGIEVSELRNYIEKSTVGSKPLYPTSSELESISITSDGLVFKGIVK